MRNKSEEETESEAPVLKCPNCPNCEPDQFQHWEDVIASRSVSGFNEDGTLEIFGSSDTGDEGENGRLVCSECYFEFPVPDDIDIEWV